MDSHRFAKRVEQLAPSSIRKMMGIARRLAQEGKTVYELNMGQPDIACISGFQEALTAKVREGHICYSPFIGETYLRETFARYLNHHFDQRKVKHLVVEKENVLVTVGASHALTSTFLALFDPGDEILCVEPFFSPYSGFMAVAGGVLKAIPTFAEQGFVLPDDDQIEKSITPKTRGILFNSPSNPSGKILSEDELTRLARLALKHNLYIIGDEVYREMILGDQESTSLLQVQLEAGLMEKFKNSFIIIDSASKSFSLCGARIGFVVGRAPIIDNIAKVVAHTVASVSDVVQYGVARAYEQILSDAEYVRNLRHTYRERLDVAMIAIKEYLPHVVAPRPDGAFYLMIQFPDLEDVNEYAMFLLERFNLGGETVAVTPAASFYLTPGRGRNEVRLALVYEPEKIRRSIFIMGEAYKAFKVYRGLEKKASLR
ncbi:MAG: aminotransferase class I/II-fold pyridoxal phosphate-dependent enzyme [Candidatus Riflebacteria bacterium]|nr:aminotransferase class I/II-fold pyridoxal phosphate-dependent enzyme [Candidatus Riflebacteria bacterium]